LDLLACQRFPWQAATSKVVGCGAKESNTQHAPFGQSGFINGLKIEGRRTVAESYFLGIDGGGTKTAAVLLNGESREVARAVSGPSNYYTVGQAVAEASLREAIHGTLASAGLAVQDVAAIGLGMAGVDRPGDRAVIGAMLSRIGRFPRVVIVNDAEAALVGGVGRRHGVVLIAGTGAIAYGINARGESRRADGWGYMVGDDGSAHWIGVEGLRAVARAHDGRGPATGLVDSLISHLGLADVGALVTLVYGEDFGVPQLAGLAPLVSQTARAGDAVAQDILCRAGEGLSGTACAVIHGLNMTDEVFEVVLTGGVLQARDVVRETVVAALGRVAPQAQVIEPRHDAAIGAALLARQTGA
jgi:N-acetylglucosamine kinase-like BadF-type ATPase